MLFNSRLITSPLNMAAVSTPSTKHFRHVRKLAVISAIGFTIWLGLAYALLPFGWRQFERGRALANRDMLTRTSQGIAGDPINIGFAGTEDDLICAFRAAGWTPASPLNLKSSLKIIGSVMLDRPYLAAPVSTLFYEGRKEDLAFQLPVGHSADERHHIRLWQVLAGNQMEEPVWLGAATFDQGIGFNHYTLQFTHHIAANIDAERQFITDALAKLGSVTSVFKIPGIGLTMNARNGGGDRYFTDGKIVVQELVSDCKFQHGLIPKVLESAPLVDLKNGLWDWLRPVMERKT